MFSKWVFVILILSLLSSCLTQEQRKQKASEYINKGFKADEQGNYQEAIKYYNQAINFCNTIPSLYLDRGLSKLNMGDIVGAIEDYKKASALDTTWEQPLYGLGSIYYNKQSKIDEATNLFHQVLSINPNSIETYLALATIYFNLKKYDSALYYFKMVSIKYPLAKEQKKKDYVGISYINYESIKAISELGQDLCYKYMGNIEQAQNYLSLAVQGGVAEAQDSLNTLFK